MDHDVFDEQLDMLLRQRAVPEMRSNLSYRIVEASRQIPQEKTVAAGISAQVIGLGGRFLKGVAGVLDYVVLPQPAFAMAVVVIMLGGAAFGALDASTFLSNIGYSSSFDSNDIETFIMTTDSFEYGDFL